MFLLSFLLLLSVLFSIPLSTKATIVDDPGVFNFSPFYDPASGVIGLSLTFFPSEEGDTVYIPDYIYENNQYKYVVCINTGAFFDCHAKYIRLPNHLRFIRDNAFVTPFYCTSVSGNNASINTTVNVVPANTAVCINGQEGDAVYAIATTSSGDNISVSNNRCFRLRRLAGLTNDTEHVKKLREWIKRNPKRAKELGYTNM